MSSIGTLVFSDEPDDGGRHRVLDPDGREVASFENPEPGRSFTAKTPDGEVLCSGTPRRLRRTYLVRDAAGHTMVTFRNPAVRLTRTNAWLADGSKLRVRTARGRDWRIEDARRRALVTVSTAAIEPLNGWRKTVQVGDRQMSLAMIVALVVGRLQHAAGDTIWFYFGDTRP